MKERVEATNELNRYRKLQRKLIDSRIKMEKELLEIPGKISHQRDKINGCEKDAEYYAKWKALNPPPSDNNEKKKEAESRRELREVIGKSVRENILEIKEKKLISYRGFDIILPANMKPEKPYVWLKRDGKYYVEEDLASGIATTSSDDTTSPRQFFTLDGRPVFAPTRPGVYILRQGNQTKKININY